MKTVLDSLGSVFAIIAALAVVAGMMLFLLKSSRDRWRKRFREPFHEGILRPPGWGCLEMRHDAMFDLAGFAGMLPTLWAGLAYVIITDRGPIMIGCLLTGLPLTVVGLDTMRRSALKARTSRLGFLGECAVAEALVPLGACGWRVFHDLPMESKGRKFNIDHVAVGPGGVWAIETKSYSKPKEVKGSGNGLRIEGSLIVFPDGTRKSPLKQAAGQAAALRDRLRGEGVGPGFVEPMVVLPGWNVGYGKNADMKIRDPRNVVALLSKQATTMSEQEVEEIAKVLEQWCRVLRFDEEEEK